MTSSVVVPPAIPPASSTSASTSTAPRMSFANSFWGDRGLEALIARMKQGKHLSEEVHAMLKERAAMEEDYGRRLAKLAKTFNPKDELGTLRESLDIVRSEIERSARAHSDLANELRVKLEKPLQEFIANQSAIRKTHQRALEKHLSNRSSQESIVIKCKERYESRSLETNQLYHLVRQGTNVKETEKLRVKYEKTLNQARLADQDYKVSVDKLSDIYRTWQADMTTACIDYQKMEEDRFQFIRGNIWNYANFISGFCVTEDESCERIRLSLEKCDFEKDLALFLEKNATGSEIPRPMAYVPFAEDPMGVSLAPGPQPQQPSQQQQRLSSTIPPMQQQQSQQHQQKQEALQLPLSIGNGFSTLFNGAFGLGNNGGIGNGLNNSGRHTSMIQQSTNPRDSTISAGNYDTQQQAGYGTHPSTVGEPRISTTSNPASQYTTGSHLRPSMTSASISAPAATSSASAAIDNNNNNHHHQLEPADSFRYDPFDIPESVPVLFSVRVLYDYSATAPEELGLVKGQTIPVIATHEDGWWEGLSSEEGRPRKGLFPSNFTETLH